LTEDIWELYNVAEDFSLSNDLAAQNPQKLKELQDLFMKEAEKNFALPIDDRLFERLDAKAVGRPTLLGDRTSLTLAEGMVGIPENSFLNVKNRSKTITADIEIPAGKTANGILIAQAGRFGGWALYVINGTLAYDYNFLGISRYTVESNLKLTPGKHTVKFDFAYDGGGPGKGGMGTLYLDGKKVGEGRIERTQPGIFSADETVDVGIDLATPVVERIGAEAKSKFNGRIPKLVVEVK
jgi:arylsulfatase